MTGVFPDAVRAEADAAAGWVVDAVAAGDLGIVRLTLHPYLHWTLVDGTELRGRDHVLTMLEERDSLSAPASVVLRDGQIYRWTE